MYKVMRIDNVLAQTTMNMISGRPDIFDEIFSDDDLEKAIDYAYGENGNLHIRVDDERQQWMRGAIPDARRGLKYIKKKYPLFDDMESLITISKAYHLNSEQTWWMDIEKKIDIIVTRQIA